MMIKHENNVLCWKSGTDDYFGYRAVAEDIMGTAQALCPTSSRNLRIEIERICREIYAEGEETPAPRDELGMLTVLTSLLREQAMMTSAAGRVVMQDIYCGMTSHGWECTLPASHAGPEHIAHTTSESGKLEVCYRWAFDE